MLCTPCNMYDGSMRPVQSMVWEIILIRFRLWEKTTITLEMPARLRIFRSNFVCGAPGQRGQVTKNTNRLEDRSMPKWLLSTPYLNNLVGGEGR
jgi:hypothetical protein